MEFWNAREVRARKPYVCEECRTPIAVGDLHVYSAGKTEGVMLAFRLCLDCQLICVEGCDVFWDEGAPIGEMRRELREEHGISNPVAWARAQLADRKPREAAEARRRREAAHSERVAAELVAERFRQREDEGRSVEGDDDYDDFSLARAGAVYALTASADPADRAMMDQHPGPSSVPRPIRSLWPGNWSFFWLKPRSRRRDLVRAAALIIAEIERLDRADLVGDAKSAEVA